MRNHNGAVTSLGRDRFHSIPTISEEFVSMDQIITQCPDCNISVRHKTTARKFRCPKCKKIVITETGSIAQVDVTPNKVVEFEPQQSGSGPEMNESVVASKSRQVGSLSLPPELPESATPDDQILTGGAKSFWRLMLWGIGAVALMVLSGLFFFRNGTSTSSDVSNAEMAINEENLAVLEPAEMLPLQPPRYALSERAIVWVGVMRGDEVWFFCTGLAVGEKSVATSALAVDTLEKALKNKEISNVFVRGHGNRTLIEDFLIHPKFSPDGPHSLESRSHDVGILKTSTPLAEYCRTTTVHETTPPLSLSCYLAPPEFRVDPKNEPNVERQNISESDIDDSIPGPIKRLQLSPLAGCEGGVIADSRAVIIGFISRSLKDHSLVIPIDVKMLEEIQ